MPALPQKTASPACTTAFNRGCDARLDGTPLEDNPYKSLLAEHECWIRGWRDVHGHWEAFLPIYARRGLRPIRYPKVRGLPG